MVLTVHKHVSVLLCACVRVYVGARACVHGQIPYIIYVSRRPLLITYARAHAYAHVSGFSTCFTVCVCVPARAAQVLSTWSNNTRCSPVNRMVNKAMNPKLVYEKGQFWDIFILMMLDQC